jgi:hypothetical protein
MDEALIIIIIVSLVSLCFIVEYCLFYKCEEINNIRYIDETSSESSAV